MNPAALIVGEKDPSTSGRAPMRPHAVQRVSLTASPAPAERHPMRVYLARLAPGSRRTMRQALEVIANIATGGAIDADALPWHTLRYQHAAAIRARLAERYSPATANKMLAALRGVLREAWRLGQVGAEDFQRAIDLAPVRGERLPAGRNIGDGEVRAMVSTCADGTNAGARDAAMLALLAVGGLRRAEVVGLDLSDVDLASGAVRVVGKGNKERQVWLSNGGLRAVAAWRVVRGDEPGPLLYPVNKGDRLQQRRMTCQAIYEAVRRRAVLADVAQLTCHDFRRTFAGNLLDAGADISSVQRLMGHSSVTTTQRYDRRGEEVKRAAASLLHFPYVSPRPPRNRDK